MADDPLFEQRRRLIRGLNRAAPLVRQPLDQPCRCVACDRELVAGEPAGYFILALAGSMLQVSPVCVPCGDGDFNEMERWIRARHADVIDQRDFVRSPDEEDD
jgi:hypothetical protein